MSYGVIPIQGPIKVRSSMYLIVRPRLDEVELTLEDFRAHRDSRRDSVEIKTLGL